MSIGKVAEGIIGKRAKTLFHLIIFFGIALAMGVFVYVIAVLFSIGENWDPADPLADPASFPTAVFPSAALIALAIVMGHLLYKKRAPLLPTTVVGFLLMLAAVSGGLEWPLLWMDKASWPGVSGTRTSIVLSTFKETRQVSVAPTALFAYEQETA